MADFATLRCANAASFTGGVRWKIVVEHIAIGVLTLQRIDTLRFFQGAECGNHNRLGLAAREQRRTVGAWQHRLTDRDGPNGAGIATVNAWLTIKDLAANNLGFDIEQQRGRGIRQRARQ